MTRIKNSRRRQQGPLLRQIEELVENLPPTLGKFGSVVFFFALFSSADKDKGGYEQFRKCHGNCINGLLHAIGMPLAVSGVFTIVRAVSASSGFTRVLQSCVTTGYLILYLRYETNPWSPWLFYIVYMSVFDFYLYHKLYQYGWTRCSYLICGIALVVLNVGALESIGHGVYENHHSYVKEFFNSVFHTPLYGANSVLGTFAPQADHQCW